MKNPQASRAHVLLVGLVAVLVTVSCNLSSTETVIITATPEGGIGGSTAFPTPNNEGVVFVVATPAQTDTPQPLAIPNMPPQDEITQAESALFNGDYVLAVAHYQGVLNQPSSSESLRASAYYGLGQAALREGLFNQAVEALSQFIQRYPTDPRLPQAHFQRGDAYMGAFNWQSAIRDFEIYLQLRPGLIDSYAYERIGDAYLSLGSPDQAFENYVEATNSTRSTVSLFALRERIAASYLNQGEYNLATQQYDAILAEAQNAPYRASIEYQAALAEIGGGNSTTGYSRMQALIQLYPQTAGAYHALSALLRAGYEVDNWLRAQISFANEDYGDVIAALNTYSTEVSPVPPEVLLMLGRAYRELGNFDAAYSTFQSILDQYPNDSLFGLAWLEQGRTRYWSGDVNGAIARYGELPTSYPNVTEAAEALWRVGYLYATELNDAERALGTFDTLGRTYPGNEWSQDGLRRAAALALTLGQAERAMEFYTQLANTGTGENRALALFWLGKVYVLMGQTELANNLFLGASEADAGGYYSLRAADILSNTDPFTPPASYRFEFNEGVELAEAEQWLRNTFGIQQEGALYPLSGALENDPHMTRGRELWALAAFDEAREEFDVLLENYAQDPLAIYQLAHYYSEIGLYRTSIEAAAALLTMAGVSTYDAPGYIARLRYPIHYADLVLPNAEKNNLDPLLVFSLIRQESLFQAFATSFAAAQGLMQIIPSTGEDIANSLNWPNYQNSDVYRPYINVTFGTYYLRFCLDFVDNVPYAALAGYNGGPGNGYSWLQTSGPDIDKFVETIGFDETRTYVIRIYEQYAVYKHLYGVGE